VACFSELIRKIFLLSWPAALVQVSWNASYIYSTNILSRLQEGSITAMAALTSSLRIEAIIYLPVFALNMAASVLTGQTLGAGAPARAETIAGIYLFRGWPSSVLWRCQSSSGPKHFLAIAKDPQVLDETVAISGS